MNRLFAVLLFACALVGTAFAQAIPIKQGLTATLSVTADGTAPFTYQWKKGTTVLPQTTSTITLANVSAADTATYTAIVSNAFGSAQATVDISIGQPPSNVKISVVQQVVAWLKKVFGRMFA